MQLVIKRKTLIYSALLGAVIFVTGVVLGYRVFPSVVEKEVWKNTILKENTTQWERFLKIPFPFQIKAHFFNVLNPDDILQGAKPVVKEIGPYVYNFYRWKSDIEWNSDEVSYYDYTRLEFDQQASGNLKEDDIVTILNLPLNALILTVEEMFPDALPTVNEELSIVMGENNGLFITANVHDLLFTGQILCENGGEAEFPAKMICDQFRIKAKDSAPMEIVGKHINFAYLRYKNYTHLGRFTINSGQKQREHVSDLIKYENREYISVWKDGKSVCNKIGGTTLFRPYVTENMTFEVFGEDVCRMMKLSYNRTETVKGITGYRYVVPRNTFNRPQPNSPDYCYCINRSREITGEFVGCLGDGLLDMTTCMGAPILLSFPHLLYADDRYKTSVKGLHPNESLHDTFATLEPISGAPLKMAKRVQFNMFLRAVPEIAILENVTNSLIPILWVEESMTLSDDMVRMIKKMLLNNLKILEIVKWGLIIVGAITVLVAIILIISQL